HRQPGRAYRLTSCIAKNMTDHDVFLLSDWGLDGYLPYFFNKNELNLVVAGTTLFDKPDPLVRFISDSARNIQTQGGTLYSEDFHTYSQDRRTWLHDITGLSESDLDVLADATSFVCDNTPIRRLHSNGPPVEEVH